MAVVELTKNGVCYNLEQSPYYQDHRGYRFYFSSETHRRKFVERVRSREAWLCDSMEKRFRHPCDFSLLAAFQLYRQIETRGFHVASEKGKSYDAPSGLRFVTAAETAVQDGV